LFIHLCTRSNLRERRKGGENERKESIDVLHTSIYGQIKQLGRLDYGDQQFNVSKDSQKDFLLALGRIKRIRGSCTLMNNAIQIDI
jgi:hypothetical protein